MKSTDLLSKYSLRLKCKQLRNPLLYMGLKHVIYTYKFYHTLYEEIPGPIDADFLPIINPYKHFNLIFKKRTRISRIKNSNCNKI